MVNYIEIYLSALQTDQLIGEQETQCHFYVCKLSYRISREISRLYVDFIVRRVLIDDWVKLSRQLCEFRYRYDKNIRGRNASRKRLFFTEDLLNSPAQYPQTSSS